MPEPTSKSTAEFRLNILIENSENMFVGWCMETGLSATGLTLQDCVKHLVELNCEHISFALENDNPGDIFNAPPTTVMSKFLMVAKQGEAKPAENMDKEIMCTPLFALNPAIYASTSI